MALRRCVLCLSALSFAWPAAFGAAPRWQLRLLPVLVGLPQAASSSELAELRAELLKLAATGRRHLACLQLGKRSDVACLHVRQESGSISLFIYGKETSLESSCSATPGFSCWRPGVDALGLDRHCRATQAHGRAGGWPGRLAPRLHEGHAHRHLGPRLHHGEGGAVPHRRPRREPRETLFKGCGRQAPAFISAWTWPKAHWATAAGRRLYRLPVAVRHRLWRRPPL